MATIPASPRSTTITLAESSAGPFDIGFRLFEGDSVDVFVDDDPVTTGFSIAFSPLNGYDDNAQITFDDPLEAGNVIRLDGALMPQRQQNYFNGDPGLTQKLNIELGRLWAAASEARRQNDRSIKIIGDGYAFMPEPNHVVIIDDEGRPASGPSVDEVSAAQGYASAAATSESNAAVSASAANEDAIATAADREQTGLDATATAADRVQTGLDRVATGEDATATAADRVQTGLDATAAGDAAVAAEGWAGVAADNSRLEIGTVTTVDAGGPATATITGDPGEQLLNLGIPEGEKGDSYTHPNHTGHVTSDGDGATTIGEGVVTNAMLAEAGPNIVKGVSGAAGPVTDVFLPPPSVLGRGSTGGLLGLGIGAGIEVADDEIRAANEMALRDRATTAQIRGFTGDAGVTTERLADAAALISPSGASNWAPDWAAFVSANWAIDGNRTLSNPTDVIAGTTRVVRVAGNNSTARTISFGANYVGNLDVPTVTDAAPILLSLFARTTTEIWVSFVEDTS